MVGNFHNYTVLLKSCANLLSFSLWINTTQCFMEDWDSLTLTLFGGKKKQFRLESFTLRSIILLFATQKLCPSSPLCLSLFEISTMFLDVEIDAIIVLLAEGKLLCRLLRDLIWGRLTRWEEGLEISYMRVNLQSCACSFFPSLSRKVLVDTP